MQYYIFAFFIYYLAITKTIKNKTPTNKLLFISSLLPIFFIAVFRGDVGTDTNAYLQIISSIQKDEPTNLEFGFVLLVKLLLTLELPPRFILATITTLSTGLAIYAASFSKRSMLLTALCIVPIFYMDMTMNGLRYGLAFTCAMCATGLFYRGKLHFCMIFAICSVAFHLSGWLIFMLMAFLSDDKVEFKKWLIITAGSGALLLAMNTGVLNYTSELSNTGVDLQGKIYVYSNSPSPSLFSGLAPLVISLISLALISRVDCAQRTARARRLYILITGILLSFLISKFSYAGLRLQFVLLFVILLCLQFKPAFWPMEQVRINKKILLTLALIGALGVAAFIKNIWISEGVGPSPWLPYSINPEIMDALDMLTSPEIRAS